MNTNSVREENPINVDPVLDASEVELLEKALQSLYNSINLISKLPDNYGPDYTRPLHSLARHLGEIFKHDFDVWG